MTTFFSFNIESNRERGKRNDQRRQQRRTENRSFSLSPCRFATLYRRFEESTLTFLLQQRRQPRRQLETYSKQFTSPFLSFCGTHGNASFRLSQAHTRREIQNIL